MPASELGILIVVLALVLQPIIPLRRRASGMSGFPFVTTALLALNILAYFATAGAPEAAGPTWGLVPQHARPHTLVTHLFLHGDLLHLLGNMVALWLIGPHVEEALGRAAFALFYLGAGIASGLLHTLLATTLLPETLSTPLIGASGAVFGLLGLFAVRFWRTRVRLFVVAPVPAIWAVALLIGLQLLSSIRALITGETDGVAYWAHLGGFCFGALLAAPLKMREASRREYGFEDAEAALRAGQLELAAAHYRQLLALSPDDPLLHRTLGRICALLAQTEASQRHFREALTQYGQRRESPQIVRTYAEAIESLPRLNLSATTLTRVASAAEEMHQYQLTLDLLATLCREHPHTNEGQMALLRLGKLHLHKLNQPDNAAAVFAEFLRLYPRSALADHARHLQTEAERHRMPESV